MIIEPQHTYHHQNVRHLSRFHAGKYITPDNYNYLPYVLCKLPSSATTNRLISPCVTNESKKWSSPSLLRRFSFRNSLFWINFSQCGVGNFSPKTAYFSSSKYEQGSQTLSFTYGENLAQNQEKELPKDGNLSTILKRKKERVKEMNIKRNTELEKTKQANKQKNK